MAMEVVRPGSSRMGTAAVIIFTPFHPSLSAERLLPPGRPGDEGGGLVLLLPAGSDFLSPPLASPDGHWREGNAAARRRRTCAHRVCME